MKINGTKVADATSRLKITITPNDVRKGDNKNPSSCAAAVALLRQCGASQARVHIGRTYLKIDNKWVRYQTPKSLRSEIIAFDRGGKFEPGDHELMPLPPSERLKRGKRQGGDDKTDRNSRRNGTKRKSHHTVTGIRPHGANR